MQTFLSLTYDSIVDKITHFNNYDHAFSLSKVVNYLTIFVAILSIGSLIYIMFKCLYDFFSDIKHKSEHSFDVCFVAWMEAHCLIGIGCAVIIIILLL